MEILGNNLTKRFKLGGPSKLHSAKPWKELHFVMRVLKKGNRNTKRSTPRRADKAKDRVQKKDDQFTNHTKVSDWETLDQRRMITRLYALFKASSGEQV
jgi:hypothetical protein